MKTAPFFKSTLCLILMGAFVTTGCRSTRQVADARDITLSNALISVTKSLQGMRREARNGQPFGLYPADVEVTFNLSASVENSSELKVDLSAPAASPVPVGVGAAAGSKATALRGNQITIKFSNLMDGHPVNTLVGKHGTNVIEIIKALQEAGLTSK